MATGKKPSLEPLDGRVMAGVTTAATTTWGECVHPEGKIVIFDVWCKKCGICTEFCPTGALANRPDKVPYLAEPDKCTLCGLCWLRCPDMAIIKGPELLENEPTEKEAEITRSLLCEAGDDGSCKIELAPAKPVIKEEPPRSVSAVEPQKTSKSEKEVKS